MTVKILLGMTLEFLILFFNSVLSFMFILLTWILETISIGKNCFSYGRINSYETFSTFLVMFLILTVLLCAQCTWLAGIFIAIYYLYI